MTTQRGDQTKSAEVDEARERVAATIGIVPEFTLVDRLFQAHDDGAGCSFTPAETKWLAGYVADLVNFWG